jgi:hypothetical protein
MVDFVLAPLLARGQKGPHYNLTIDFVLLSHYLAWLFLVRSTTLLVSACRHPLSLLHLLSYAMTVATPLSSTPAYQ